MKGPSNMDCFKSEQRSIIKKGFSSGKLYNQQSASISKTATVEQLMNQINETNHRQVLSVWISHMNSGIFSGPSLSILSGYVCFPLQEQEIHVQFQQDYQQSAASPPAPITMAFSRQCDANGSFSRATLSFTCELNVNVDIVSYRNQRHELTLKGYPVLPWKCRLKIVSGEP